MANEISIRVRGEDDGSVARVMRKIEADVRTSSKAIASEPVLGPAIKPRFDFQEQLVRDEEARMLNRVRSDAEREKIKIKAEVIVDEAKWRKLVKDVQNGTADQNPAKPAIDPGLSGSFGTAKSKISPEDLQAPKTLAERYGELAGKLVALHGVMKIAEAGLELFSAVAGERSGDMKKAAEGWIGFSEAIGRIPIVGQFALSAVDKLTGGALEKSKAALEYAEKVDERIEEMRKKHEEREQHGSQLVDASRDPTVAAQRALALSGKDGEDRAKLEAQLDYQEKSDDLNRQWKASNSDKDLTQDKREQLQKNIDIQRLAARQGLIDALQKIDTDGWDKSSEAEAAHTDAMHAKERQAAVDDLDLAGRHHDAKLKAIQNEYDAEQDALSDKLYKEQQGLKGDDPRYEEAQQRHDEALAAAERQRNQKTAAENQQNGIDTAHEAQDAEDRILEIKAKGAEAQLRAAGKARDADKLQRDEAFREEIEQIDRKYDDEIRAHGENRAKLEEQREREKQAANDANLAQEEQVTSDQANKQRGEVAKVAAGDTRLLTGLAGTTDPTLEPIQLTAKNTTDALKVAQDTVTAIGKLSDTIINTINFASAPT